jgi:hypothetical protein
MREVTTRNSLVDGKSLLPGKRLDPVTEYVAATAVHPIQSISHLESIIQAFAAQFGFQSVLMIVSALLSLLGLLLGGAVSLNAMFEGALQYAFTILGTTMVLQMVSCAEMLCFALFVKKP